LERWLVRATRNSGFESKIHSGEKFSRRPRLSWPQSATNTFHDPKRITQTTCRHRNGGERTSQRQRKGWRGGTKLAPEGRRGRGLRLGQQRGARFAYMRTSAITCGLPCRETWHPLREFGEGDASDWPGPPHSVSHGTRVIGLTSWPRVSALLHRSRVHRPSSRGPTMSASQRAGGLRMKRGNGQDWG
jgi:hypothetical protein